MKNLKLFEAFFEEISEKKEQLRSKKGKWEIIGPDDKVPAGWRVMNVTGLPDGYKAICKQD